MTVYRRHDPPPLHIARKANGRGVTTVPAVGPGYELKSLLRKFRIVPKNSCKCEARALIMDQNGPEWCEQNVETIVGWMKEEADERHLPFPKVLARLLVKRAVRNARRKLEILSR